MKHLYHMAAELERAGVAVGGENLFIGTMPSDVTRGVMLLDPLAGHEIDEGMRGFFDTSFQAVTRDPDPDAAYALAVRVSKALTMTNMSGDGVDIAWCRPATLPISYPRGDADDIETSVRFRVGFRLT